MSAFRHRFRSTKIVVQAGLGAFRLKRSAREVTFERLGIMYGMGDRIRVRQSPETIAAGIAGEEGEIYGFTVPSASGVQAIGGAPDDYALYVSLAATDTSTWLRPDLAEFLDHNPGVNVVVGDRRLIRQADGSWLEDTAPPTQEEIAEAERDPHGRTVRAFKSNRKCDT